MNKILSEGRVKIIKGALQEMFGQVTGNEEIESIGLKQQLVGTIQEIYNISAISAEGEIEEICPEKDGNIRELIKELQCCKLILTALQRRTIYE